MGAGRKTQTVSVGERVEHVHKGNSNPGYARNLRKKELGGVIFGCTHYTIKECITGLLFGLPEMHFSYIKNIMPGMPLFLFNYSDRKLHGIFEAAGHGMININPHGWTENGSGITQYPAQVRVRIRRKCQSLSEEAFREVLRKNYNNHDSKNHFQFELDHSQLSQLISLFECSPVGVASPFPTVSCKIPLLPEKHTMMVTPRGMGPNIVQNHEDEDTKLLKEACCQHLKMESEFRCDLPCSSRRNWASLFKENSAHDARTAVDATTPRVSELNLDEKRPVSLNCSNTDLGSPCVTFGWDKGHQIMKTYSDRISVKDEAEIIYNLQQVAFDRSNCNLEEHTVAVDHFDTVNTCSINQLRKELEELKAFSTEQLRKASELEKKLDAIERRQASVEQRSEPSITEEWELTGLDGMKNW